MPGIQIPLQGHLTLQKKSPNQGFKAPNSLGLCTVRCPCAPAKGLPGAGLGRLLPTGKIQKTLRMVFQFLKGKDKKKKRNMQQRPCVLQSLKYLLMSLYRKCKKGQSHARKDIWQHPFNLERQLPLMGTKRWAREVTKLQSYNLCPRISLNLSSRLLSRSIF